MRKSVSKGFTLLEMVIVMAVVALIAAVSFPTFSRLQQREQVNGATRTLLADLRSARALAATGQRMDNPLDNPDAPMIRFGGIQFISETQYQIYGDNNDVFDSAETFLKTLDLEQMYPGTSLRFVVTPGEHIRFNARGIREYSSRGQVVIEDTSTGLRQAIEINSGGSTRIDPRGS